MLLFLLFIAVYARGAVEPVLCSYVNVNQEKGFVYDDVQYLFGKDGYIYSEKDEQMPVLDIQEPAYAYSRVVLPRKTEVAVLPAVTVNASEMQRIVRETVRYVKKKSQEYKLSVWLLARGGFYFEKALQEEGLPYKSAIVKSASVEHVTQKIELSGFDQDVAERTICVVDDVLDNGVTTAVTLIKLREKYPNHKFILAFCWLKQGRKEPQISYTIEGKNAFQRVVHALAEQKHILKIGKAAFKKAYENGEINIEKEIEVEKKWLEEHVLDTYAHMTLDDISVPEYNIQSLEGWLVFAYAGANFFTKREVSTLDKAVAEMSEGEKMMFLFKSHTGRGDKERTHKETLYKISNYVEEMGIPFTYALLNQDGSITYKEKLDRTKPVILFSEVPEDHPAVAHIPCVRVYTDFSDVRKGEKLLKPFHIVSTIKVLPTRTLVYTPGPVF